MSQKRNPVVVIGSGNAGLCSAISAADAGADVLVIEWAKQELAGGNTFYSGGSVRCAHNGVDDLYPLIEDTGESKENLSIDPYDQERFFGDLAEASGYRGDGILLSKLVGESLSSLKWLKSLGVRFELSHRHLVKKDGKSHFTGGSTIGFFGAGQGAVEQMTQVALRLGVRFRYGTRLLGVLQDDQGRVRGARVSDGLDVEDISTSAVILACGGFEGNGMMRAQFLGAGWDLAHVRGTAHNTGDGIQIGLRAGAQAVGHWSGCHAVCWDVNAPMMRDHSIAHGFERESYPHGVLVNNFGQRFVDEGADFFPYTYVKYGRAVMTQPEGVAFQIFDDKVKHLLQDEYSLEQTTRVEAQSLAEVAAALDIDTPGLEATIAEFNHSTAKVGSFDTSVKDGLSTTGLTVPKSNWALPIDSPPYLAFPVTTGISFTFGGLKIDASSRVVDWSESPVPGLFAAGEIVGGLYYHNYPGGTGLTAGAVFGKQAGIKAAELVIS